MKREYWFLLAWVVLLSLIALFLVSPPAGSSKSAGTIPASAEPPVHGSPMTARAAGFTPTPAGEAQSAHTSEWPQWIHALRAAGVPEKLVGDVIAAEFEHRWQDRLHAIEAQLKRGETDDQALAQFHLQHDTEREEVMRSALGEEGFRRWDRERTLRESNLAGLDLSASETDALYQLRKNLDQKTRELEKARLAGMVDERDYERLAEAKLDQYDRELKTLLGRERYAATESPSGGASGEIRRALQQTKATDAQADILLQTQQQWSDQREQLGRLFLQDQLTGPEYEQEIKALDAARDGEYRRVLGDEGFAEFQKALDHRYKTMKRYAPAWGLSESDIDYLYRMQQYYESSVRDYREQAQTSEKQGQPVDWNAVQSGIKQFSAQTQQTLRSYLGDERFNKMTKNEVLTLER